MEPVDWINNPVVELTEGSRPAFPKEPELVKLLEALPVQVVLVCSKEGTLVFLPPSLYRGWWAIYAPCTSNGTGLWSYTGHDLHYLSTVRVPDVMRIFSRLTVEGYPAPGFGAVSRDGTFIELENYYIRNMPRYRAKLPKPRDVDPIDYIGRTCDAVSVLPGWRTQLMPEYNLWAQAFHIGGMEVRCYTVHVPTRFTVTPLTMIAQEARDDIRRMMEDAGVASLDIGLIELDHMPVEDSSAKYLVRVGDDGVGRVLGPFEPIDGIQDELFRYFIVSGRDLVMCMFYKPFRRTYYTAHHVDFVQYFHHCYSPPRLMVSSLFVETDDHIITKSAIGYGLAHLMRLES